MTTRYRLIRRGLRNQTFYCVDNQTGQRTSLRTGCEDEARQIVQAKNQAERQPEINLQIAKAYLAAADAGFVNRTWREVMAEFLNTKKGKNQTRSERAIADKAYDPIRELPLIETKAEHFLKVLRCGKVSTNSYLRRFHNFAVDLGWLPWPVLPKRRWPAIKHKERRGITREEHQRIVAWVSNPEMRAFLSCCWHIGGSQSDVARLRAEDIDWTNQVVGFFRAKTGSAQIIRFGDELATILRDLARQGWLFPRLAEMDEKHRASLFQTACRRLKISGISLHSYRYAWAERARLAGYPERFAQEALGHNSKAVHRSYAKRAQVTLPSLEEYEQHAHSEKVISIKMQHGGNGFKTAQGGEI